MTGIPRYGDVCAFQSLLAAYRKARKAKRGKGDEPLFTRDLESNLLDLSDQLGTRTFVPDPYRYFSLHNKKDRVVSVASFRDRVVHHALVAVLEPVYEMTFIPTSFACRKNKGMHRALKLARGLSQKWRYFLKMDIRKYFDHISHPILLDILSRQVDDEGIMWLCDTLLRNARVPEINPAERRGVPIGNLTSQFWANVYLDQLDHAVAACFPGNPYLRYMDDILVFGDGPEDLWPVERATDEFVSGRLALELKTRATEVAPVTEGIPWLGFRVYPGLIRLDHDSRTRFLRKMVTNMKLAEESASSDEHVVASAASLCGHVVHCDSRHFRQSIICGHVGD